MNDNALLVTKLHIPQTRYKLVPRSRLLEQINEGIKGKLSLVCAPAGFGKSTLLAAWTKQQTHVTAWITLDEADNDLRRFWRHVLGALQIHLPDLIGAQTLLESSNPRFSEIVLTLIINALANQTEQVCLILDDYHVINTAEIHHSLAFLLEHLPLQLHLVLASRVDPPLPLANLRGRGQLCEVRAEDLRFTDEEAFAFFNEAMGLHLSEHDSAALGARTEGWAVGMQLAALSLQKELNPSAFIATFKGDNRFIIDYLVDEIFTRQTSEVQQFFLATALLDRFCADLCDALLDNALFDEVIDSQAMLEYLEHANLFIIPLDNQRRWYRYHRLFADLLRYRLERDRKEMVAQYHQRAGRWFAEQGLVDEALNHFGAIGEAGQAADLIEQLGETTLWGRGEVSRLTGWLERLPESLRQNRPKLAVLSAWIKHLSGDIAAIFPLVEQAELQLKRAASSPEARHLLSECATLRAYVARMEGDLEHSLELYQQAFDLLPPDQPKIRDGVAEALFLAGDLPAATQLYSEALEYLEARGEVMPASFCLWRLAKIQLVQGQLRQAHATCQRMLELTKRHQVIRSGLGYAEVQLGCLFYEWNDLPQAELYLRAGIERGEQLANPRVFLPGLVHLAKLLQAQGKPEAAYETIAEALEVTQQHQIGWTWGLPNPLTTRVRLALTRGELQTAIAWAAAFAPEHNQALDFRYECDQLLCSRVLLAQGKTEEALSLLAKLEQRAEQAERWGHVIEIHTLQALVYHALGKDDAAYAKLQEALRRAEPEGYVRHFLDEGLALKEMLETFSSRRAPAYVGKLLEAFRNELPSAQPQSKPLQANVLIEHLVEPLNEREQTILRLLGARLSDKEIAKELSLSVNTIKWYDRNIYSKLGVSTRRQAINKGKELGLL